MKNLLNYLGKETYGSLGHFDERNYIPICFSLAEFHYEPKTIHLIKNFSDLKDNDYMAFGVGLPQFVIMEVFKFAKKYKNKFSTLIQQYPFAQLVFLQWLTIKLYERQKYLNNNFNLEYEEFLKQFTSSFNHKNYNLLYAIDTINMQNLNHQNDASFNIIDTTTALNPLNINHITLYDIIYDIIPNSIRKIFLKDEESLKKYLPLRQGQFFYQEIKYQNPKEIFTSFYGEDSIYDEENIPKKYYKFDTLSLQNYKIDSIIPKAKINKLGIGYDELLELINRNETHLNYPEIYEFEWVNDTSDCLEDGIVCTPMYKVVFSQKPKHKANYEDMVRLSQTSDSASIFFITQGEVHADDEVYRAIRKQFYDARAFLLQNNFHTQNLIFESYRMKLKEDEEMKKQVKKTWSIFYEQYPGTHPKWYAWIVLSDAYLSYRFNQALALAFLNAYEETSI